jgi:hypothetical protein
VSRGCGSRLQAARPEASWSSEYGDSVNYACPAPPLPGRTIHARSHQYVGSFAGALADMYGSWPREVLPGRAAIRWEAPMPRDDDPLPPERLDCFGWYVARWASKRAGPSRPPRPLSPDRRGFAVRAATRCPSSCSAPGRGRSGSARGERAQSCLGRNWKHATRTFFLGRCFRRRAGRPRSDNRPFRGPGVVEASRLSISCRLILQDGVEACFACRRSGPASALCMRAMSARMESSRNFDRIWPLVGPVCGRATCDHTVAAWCGHYLAWRAPSEVAACRHTAPTTLVSRALSCSPRSHPRAPARTPGSSRAMR